jgi:hypothetical protein
VVSSSPQAITRSKPARAAIEMRRNMTEMVCPSPVARRPF